MWSAAKETAAEAVLLLPWPPPLKEAGFKTATVEIRDATLTQADSASRSRDGPKHVKTAEAKATLQPTAMVAAKSLELSCGGQSAFSRAPCAARAKESALRLW